MSADKAHAAIWKKLPHSAQNTLAFCVVVGVLCLIAGPLWWLVALVAVFLAVGASEALQWGHSKNHSWPQHIHKAADKLFDRELKREGASWAETVGDIKPLIAKPGEPGWLPLGKTEVKW